MKYTFLFLLILAFSCTSPQKQETIASTKDLNEMSLEEILEVPITFSDKEYTLEKINEINIPIDSVSSNSSAYPIYHDADTAQYYVQGNEAINSIDFYDLEKKELYKRVKFERTGNQMISSTRKIFIKNADSIYIFEDRYGRIDLVNINGEILERYDLPKKHRHLIYTNMASSFLVHKNKVYFCADIFSGREPANITKEFIETRNTTGIFDLVTRELAFEDRTAPLYLANSNIIPEMLYTSNFFDENYTIVFTPLSGHIQYLKNEKNTQTILRKKNFNKEMLKKMKRNSNGIRYDSYFSIFADKKNDMFYTVVLEGIEEKDLDGNPNSYDDQLITIVIADEKFHHAGEITLPKDTHFRNIMATKEGLLVSNANPKNPNNDESVLSFTLYKPKKIK